jgi:hypothetical protein
MTRNRTEGKGEEQAAPGEGAVFSWEDSSVLKTLADERCASWAASFAYQFTDRKWEWNVDTGSEENST